MPRGSPTYAARSRYAALTQISLDSGNTGVLDETPGAYKDIDAFLAAQSDLVDVVQTLKQVLCVKG